MFAKQYSKKVANVIAQKFQAHCDEEFDEFGSVPTLVELADEQEQIKQVIKRPMSYEAVRTQLLGSASVNTFDGFRLMVAKQVNLNSVSQHTFMLGSSQTQNQPYYNYTLILPLDEKQEKSARIRSDLDFNVDGEFTWPLSDSVGLKASLALSDNGNACSVEFDHGDEASSTQLNINILNKALSFSYMQALTPSLALGAMGTFTPGKQEFSSQVNAVYNRNEDTVAASFDFDSNNAQMIYKKEVNPNRVNLLTEVEYDGKSGASKMNASAQYILKQSKLTMGVDSDLTMRTTIESNIAQGVQLSISAELPQLQQDQCRFGYALLMG